MIDYTDSLAGITARMLIGFFEGWPNPPSPRTHLRVLAGSDAIALAVDRDSGRVVGFAAALTDDVLVAYITLLEVLPDYRGSGIGSALVRRLLDRFGDLYAVDVLCDEDVRPFYARLGLEPAHGMARRRYDRQAGRAAHDANHELPDNAG